MSKEDRSLTVKQITPEILSAVAASIEMKGKAAAQSGVIPVEWTTFIDAMNKSEVFKEMLHQHAHAVMTIAENGGCKQATSGVAMAVVWGFEIAMAMTESKELAYLLN